MNNISKANKGLCNLMLLSFLSFFVVFPYYHHHESTSDTHSIEEDHNCQICQHKAYSGDIIDEIKKKHITVHPPEVVSFGVFSFTTILTQKSNLIRGPPAFLI